MFAAVAKKGHDIDALLPPERIVTLIHELSDKLGKHKDLNNEAVEKLLALATMRGVPDIRTRRALEAVRRLHPMTKGAAQLMKTRLDATPYAPPKPWTFFIYMASENNLEPYAVKDICDMEAKFKDIAKFANVVVLADGGAVNDEDKTLGPQPANNWIQRSRLILIEASDVDGHVMSRTIPVPNDSELGELMVERKGDLNLGSPETLRRSIDFVQKGIPSEHMFFSVWSHGLAWKGIAEDENAGRGSDMLRPHELIEAMADLKQPPDVMGFDACLMANSGVGALLQQLGSKYMVGSEELLDATGWGYHRVFEGLAKAEKKAGELTPEALAHTLVDSAHGTTLSAVKLDAAPKTDIAKAAQEMCETTHSATHYKNMHSESYPGIEDYSHGLTTYLPRKGEDFLTHYLGKGAVWKA